MLDPHDELLRHLETNPEATQRELAEAMGLSVGKTHYALRALIDRGLVKVENFRRADNKKAYLYKLTPQGMTEKSRLAMRFLQRKRAEYDALKKEIEQLEQEAEVRVLWRQRIVNARKAGASRYGVSRCRGVFAAAAD